MAVPHTFGSSGPTIGYPTTLRDPFRWDEIEETVDQLQAFDDLIDLLVQLSAQLDGHVIFQATEGTEKVFRFCRVTRQRTDIPIHVVAENLSPNDEVSARAIGVSSLHDVSQGYGALCRRLGGTPEEVQVHASRRLSVGTLSLDLSRHKVTVGDTPVALTKTEFEILRAMAEQPGQILLRQELISRVWGENWYGAPNVLDTHLAHLRSKLHAAGLYNPVATVRGIGFYLEPNDTIS